ncbi:MAG TPA: hypothetical protein PKA28_14160 [Methylomusa anaerophila]|uniref:Uncharacterized protein n=1 Tax=Methylomusa anaerophila TaxID=1930071 RepID=A0A348AEZ3_9FIRM|nr:hypothetical protein [Methylomusa anaerophila]BBB89641.1 hypothetical protein MAMMFC1_00274 [Methylomusa anaerophila]HML89583.1 hypothetical protein [Methylomusa anaerophila]
MNCERCGEPITENESFKHHGKLLCEDCYIGALQPPKTCDVAAVHAAKKHREMFGQTGTEGLTALQQEIYNYIKEQGKATRPELMAHFKLPEWELEKQFSILRHCELVKGRKEEDQIYLVPFDS